MTENEATGGVKSITRPYAPPRSTLTPAILHAGGWRAFGVVRAASRRSG
jgi:hypothetical protein